MWSVSFHEFAADLRAIATSCWRAEYDGAVAELPGAIAPDAHVEFVFQTGAPVDVEVGSAVRPTPRAMVYAQSRGLLRMKPRGANALVAFRVLPAAATAILGASLAGAWDRPVDLEDHIGDEALRLLDRLAAAPVQAFGGAIEGWLRSRLQRWNSEAESNQRLQFALIWNATSERLCELDPGRGSERALRRRCEKYAGIAAKEITMAGRMLRSCDLLIRAPGKTICDVALSLGFADQAAFTNAFRRRLGVTPADLRRERLVYYEKPPF